MGKLFGGFSASELKPRLKMATHRFQLSIAKKSAIMRQQKREIALMLAETPHPKEEKARIRAEALIREDNTVEAMEILQLECELLYERILLVRSQDTCPSDLVSCVSTLIWASQRVDIPELQDIRHQFRSKYGKKFDEAAITNAGGICNERVVAKLSIEPPTAILVRVRNRISGFWKLVYNISLFYDYLTTSCLISTVVLRKNSWGIRSRLETKGHMHRWITACSASDRIFCSNCRRLRARHVLISSKHRNIYENYYAWYHPSSIVYLEWYCKYQYWI